MLRSFILTSLTVLMSVTFIETTFADSILNKALGAEPKSLNKDQFDDISSAEVARNIYEGLVIMGSKGEIIPAAAEKWTVNDTATVYTFSLRKDAKWSDGSPVIAQDFVASWQRGANPVVASHYGHFYAPLKNADEILKGTIKDLNQLGARAIDDYTLEVVLKSPTPYFLGALTHASFYPMHRPSFEKFGDQYVKAGNFVGNGAYFLETWTPQEVIRIQKNPHYYDAAKVKIDTVNYYTIENQDTQFKRYKAGEIDITHDISGDQVEMIKRDKNLSKELKISPYLSTYYYVINTAKPPFNDIRVREALSLAIDREKIVTHITKTGEIPAYGFVPLATNNAMPQMVDFKNLSMKERLEKAKKFLAEAGFGPKNPLKIEILYNTNDNHKKIAIAASNMFKGIGATTELTNVEFKILLQMRQQKEYKSLARAGWVGDYNDPQAFLFIFYGDTILNDSGFKNPEFETLLKTAENTVDLKKRSEILAKAEKILLDTHSFIPIYFNVTKRLVKSRIKGYNTNILDYFYVKDIAIDEMPKSSSHKK
jgi:oligopeptide transport system substrate-binding protein